MMDNLFGLGPYSGYILACYAAAFAVLAGLALWARLSDRAARETLEQLEAAHPRRAPRTEA